MNFWAYIAEGGVSGLFKGVGELAKDVRTAITGKEPLSSEQQVELLAKVQAIESAAQQMEAQAASGQIALNLADAQSGSMFKGGWRPALGWCCVLGLSYTFLLRPLLPWSVEVGALIVGHSVVLPPMPALDTQELFALVMAMLGFGGFRMVEKIKGKS